MKKTICAACGEGGGSFVLRGAKWYHSKGCTFSPKMRDQAKSTFPFTTTHLAGPNDGPITVQSMRHLRKLENRHGVASEPYNNNQSYQGERY